MRIIYYLIIAIFSFLGGSAAPAATVSPEPRVVTQVQVIYFHDGYSSTYNYTDSHDMNAILNYLRLLDPYHKTDIDPDTFRTDSWEITLRFSDGNSTVYRQLHRKYLQKDNGIWRQIDAGDDLLFLTS